MENQKVLRKRKIVREYIKINQNCTYLDIKRETKFKIERIYHNMAEAYQDAGVPLSKNLQKRGKKKQKLAILVFIKKHPLSTVTQIQDATRCNVPRLFGSIEKAYELANVGYPEREITGGVVNPSICRRSIDFERAVITELSYFGEIYLKVRCKTGIADAVLICKNKKYVVEVKDFRARNNITNTQIKQIFGYMKSLKIKNGLLVCPKSSFPKRKNSRNVFIDGFNIKVVCPSELKGGVV